MGVTVSNINTTLGTGINTYTAGLATDTITLASAAGTDIIEQNVLGTSDAISVTNFTTGTDIIELSKAGISASTVDGSTAIVLKDVDGDGATLGATVQTVILKTITAIVDFDDTTDDANVLVLNSNVDDNTALQTALAATGTHQVRMGAALADNNAFLVMYDDGTDSFLVAVANTSGTTITNGDTLTTAELGVQTLVTFVGISDATTITVADLGGDYNA